MLHFILVFTAMISLLFFPSIFLIEQHEDMPLMSCKWSFFGSLLSFLRLVVIEETIWSEIINSFLDSPKNTQPRRTFSSLRSKRFRLVSEQRNTETGDFRFWPREKWNESQKVKEGGGGGEGRKRLQTNPSILKTCVRQRTQRLIGSASRTILTCVDQRFVSYWEVMYGRWHAY